MSDYNKEYEQAVKKFSYVVRKAKYTDKGSIRCLSYIALIDNRTGMISWLTDYADYVLYMKTSDMSFEASNDAGLYAVCQFLSCGSSSERESEI
ncbi:MAG: hypothetical protein K5662_01380 [Lachnospiraceae bacterium]|nr:hypothetical protein [Lachnospiraceae bacterium]